MRFNKINCQVLCLGHTNLMQQVWGRAAGKMPGEISLEVLVNNQLNMSRESAQVAKRANDTLACIRKRGTGCLESCEVTIPGSV